MRLASFFLLVVEAHAQITLQGKTTGSILDYYAAHPTLDGDTNYCIQTAATYANGAAAGTSVLNLNDGFGNRTISGKILCTYNDGTSSLGSGNIGLYNLTVLDMSSAANTTTVALNRMSSYGPNPGDGNVPAGWSGQCTTGQNNACDWKTGKMISVGGWIIMPVQRQDKGPYYATGDSTLGASPDGGAHWCNPYTYANHAGSPGCDSSNWQATGDAPLPPSHASYTATPSSMMWKDLTPYDGSSNPMGRQNFFDYCQDNACTGSPHGADTYLYGFGSTGRMTKYILFRVPKNINSIMNVTAYEYYTCAGYSAAHVCDGTLSGSWTSTLGNATMLFAGVGAAANGSGASINPGPTGFTNQLGVMFGSPTYYCANGGCAYVSTNYQQYLTGGHDRSGIISFPAPWGPFTPFGSEFENDFARGFWSILRYTLSTPDASPYHARFVMAGGSGVHSPSTTVFYQAYDLTIGAPQTGMNLSGCTPYRFTSSPVAGAIIRRGLWGFFDFFSHGCFNNRVGDVTWPSIFANDLATYPPDKQLVGCYSDAGVACSRPSASHNLTMTTDGLATAENGYWPRFELRDMVPGVYNQVTLSPFTSPADPAWTVSFVIKPSNISTVYQGLLKAGPSGTGTTIFASYVTPGTIGMELDYIGGTGYVVLRTGSAWLTNNTWVYLTISKASGLTTVCSALPCAPASATIHIYVNGVEVGVSVVGGTAAVPFMTAGNHTVASTLTNASFNGTFGGLEIYSRVLSLTEIQHNYKTHKARLFASRGIVLP